LLLLMAGLLGCHDGDPVGRPPGVSPSEQVGLHADGSEHLADMAATRERLREALGSDYYEPVQGLDTADLDSGRRMYVLHCAPCHGNDGRGDGPASGGLEPPPSDLTDPFHARYYSDAGRVHIIRDGVSGAAMRGFQEVLDPREIVDVYAYVKTLRQPLVPGEVRPHVHGPDEHAP
jgi:high-affinity iron transporter